MGKAKAKGSVDMVFRIIGLDQSDEWRHVQMWDQDGNKVGPFKNADEAIQEAMQLKDSIADVSWKDIAVESVTTITNRVSIDFDKSSITSAHHN